TAVPTRRLPLHGPGRSRRPPGVGGRPLRPQRPRGRLSPHRGAGSGRGPGPGNGPAGMTESSAGWLRVRARARRHAFVLRRSPHRLFDVTIWPLVDTLLFGSLAVFVSRGARGSSVAFGYLLSGIVLWHVVYQSQIAVSTGFLEETWSRN